MVSKFCELDDRIVENLKAAKSETGQTRFDSVARKVLNDVPELVMLLSRSVIEKNYDQIQLTAHELCKLFTEIGLLKLADVSFQLENAAMKKLWFDYEIRAEMLDAFTQEALDKIKNHLN